MTNAVIPANTLQVPAYLDDVFGSESNITERSSVPTLSYEGKVWSINMNGDKTKLNRKNEDGDMEPVQILRVVIVDYSKSRGRTYYEGAYEPGRALAPLCWSDDNIMPHPSIASPQSTRCDTCPKAIKGSRITEQGKPTTACAQHKFIAVVPAFKLDHPPLRLKLAITSVYDKNNAAMNKEGWYAFDQYLDNLRTHRVKHTAGVVTKVRFDPNAAWPKLLFATERWLEPDEVPQIKAVMHTPEVKQLLVGSWAGAPTGAPGDTAKPVQHVIEPPAKPAPVPVQIVAKPMQNAGVVVEVVEKPVIKAEPKKPAKTAKTANSDLQGLLDDWTE